MKLFVKKKKRKKKTALWCGVSRLSDAIVSSSFRLAVANPRNALFFLFF
jgi:hypothetical protein